MILKQNLGKIVIFVIWSFVTLMFIFYGSPFKKQRLEIFVKEELNGVVGRVYKSTGGTSFYLRNDLEHHHFCYCKKERDLGVYFDDFIEVGDSILKKSMDKNLLVFRENDIFYFPVLETLKR